MTDDHRAPIEQVRAEHGEYPNIFCLLCSVKEGSVLRPCRAETAEQALEQQGKRLTPYLELAADLQRQRMMSVQKTSRYHEFIARADAIRKADHEGSEYVTELAKERHERWEADQRAESAERRVAELEQLVDYPLATINALSRDLTVARAALEKIRKATDLALPSEQTGSGWERCVRVPVARMQAIDAAVASVLGEPVATNEPKP